MKKILGIMTAVLCMHAAVFAVEIETALVVPHKNRKRLGRNACDRLKRSA